MEILGFLIGLGIASYFYFKWYTLTKQQQEVIQLNEKKKLENKKIEEEYKRLMQLRDNEE